MGNLFRWHQWNLDHIAIHGVSTGEAEYLVNHATPPYPEPIGQGKWRVCGQTAEGRFIQVIFIFDPKDTVFVIHARGLTDREKHRLRRRMR
jgi:uncharacterized DUF497 family protein